MTQTESAPALACAHLDDGRACGLSEDAPEHVGDPSEGVLPEHPFVPPAPLAERGPDRAPAPLGMDVEDPANARYVALLARDIAVERVLDNYGDVDAFVLAKQRELDALLRDRQTLFAIAVAKMQDAKATRRESPTAGFRIRIEEGKPKRVVTAPEILLKLRDLRNGDGDRLIPEDLLDRAVLPVPKTEVKTHLTYLKKCCEYGEEAQALYEAGTREDTPPDRFIIERIDPPQKNVTGSAAPKGIRP